MNSKKRKLTHERPTLHEFHQVVKQLAPSQAFTKASIESLRNVYFTFLSEVTSSLVEHDKIVEGDGIVSKACTLGDRPLFVAWEEEARTLLTVKRKEETNTNGTTERRKKSKLSKQTIQDMEMEQERLLRKSVDTLKERHVSS